MYSSIHIINHWQVRSCLYIHKNDVKVKKSKSCAWLTILHLHGSTILSLCHFDWNGSLLTSARRTQRSRFQTTHALSQLSHTVSHTVDSRGSDYPIGDMVAQFFFIVFSMWKLSNSLSLQLYGELTDLKQTSHVERESYSASHSLHIH